MKNAQSKLTNYFCHAALEVFLELNLLSAIELEQAIATEYNPARVSFLNGPEVWVQDVLNIGIDPIFLLETFKGAISRCWRLSV